MKNLKIVLDTNVFLVSLPGQSKHHWIIQSIINESIIFLLSNEIILEYEEQLNLRYRKDFSNDVFSAFLPKKNVMNIIPEFHCNFISVDPDDNKFVDCAVAGNADYIISNDKHFQILKKINFPQVNVLTLQEFENSYKELLA